MEVNSPQIESESAKTEISESKTDKINIPDELRYNPYNYIINYYEKIYPCIGGRVFKILSLVPVSAIIPKYTIHGRKIRSHLNFLYLAPPGYCKSQCSEQFFKITKNPIMSKNMTTPRLYYELKKMQGKKISIIIEDIAVWFMDEEKIKFLEGAVGEEEKFDRENMKNIKDGMNKHVDIVSFCSGTPQNITNKRLKEGILRRFCPLILVLTSDEHKKILEFQSHGLGKESDNENSGEIIQFYKELEDIQNGKNKEINPIVDYIFPDYIKEEALNYFTPLGNKLHKLYGVNSATEHEEFFRFLVCLAFMRIFDKKRKGLIQDNHLIIDRDDLIIAKELIKNEISMKNFIYFSIDTVDMDGVNTRRRLRSWNEKRKQLGYKELPNEVKYLINSNLKDGDIKNNA